MDVRLEKGTLTLTAQLSALPDPSWTPIHAEYRLGSDKGGVAARLRNGVLELDLPKSAERQPRSIPVQACSQ